MGCDAIYCLCQAALCCSAIGATMAAMQSAAAHRFRRDLSSHCTESTDCLCFSPHQSPHHLYEALVRIPFGRSLILLMLPRLCFCVLLCSVAPFDLFTLQRCSIELSNSVVDLQIITCQG